MVVQQQAEKSPGRQYPANGGTPIRLMKRNLIKTAAIGSVFVGALAVAAPASANSFGPTDYGTGGNVMVSYNDDTDQFCATGSTPYSIVTIYPETESRSPRYWFWVAKDETKCISLNRAFEDSYYYFYVNTEDPVSFYS